MKLTRLILSLGCGTALFSGCIIVTEDNGGTDTDATSSTSSTTTASSSATASDAASDTASATDGSSTSAGTTASTSASSSTSATGGSTSAGSTGGAPGCGWGDTGIQDPAMGYICGGSGEDPEGSYAYACPDGLTAGDACGEVTGVGCCDANGDLWYCDANAMLFMESCAG